MKSVLGIAGMALALAAAGCNSSGPQGSCTTQAAGTSGMTCLDFTSGYTSSSAMSACTNPGQSYSGSACATTGRVGRCTITQQATGAVITSVLNFYGPTTVDIAMAACLAGASGSTTTTFVAN
jgi:hypothetical protein